MIESYLNIKHSTRNLTDQDFQNILPTLASELSQINYELAYTDEQLKTDWENLKNWQSSANSINSTSRVGMKLCEHFFPNFFEIEDNRGKSFKKLWQDQALLEKILTWNRKAHSTPYLSELKRGVYFCGGLAKATMYRPQMSKMVTKGAKIVLDPCAGWGGRLLGAVANGAHYIAFDPNPETFKNLNRMVDFLDIRANVTLICDDALNMDSYNLPKVDVILTSPPYFDLEVYCADPKQSITDCATYKVWEENFLTPLIHKAIAHLNPNGKSCWNVAKFGANDMWASVEKAHLEKGFTKVDTFDNVSSARPTEKAKPKKNDSTVVYQLTVDE